MSDKSLYEKYVEEFCPTCKNRTCSICSITIARTGTEVQAKCSGYEKEVEQNTIK